ncbi:MAG: molybdopterin cofactor-binding domain-containing protein, partial [Planctomycetota bacterium]
MIKDTSIKEILSPEDFDSVETSSGQVRINRRTFVQMLGAGLLITVTEGVSIGQRRRGGGRSIAVAARVQINTDGTINVMTGKVEEGQGPRAQLSQAAAEELRVDVDKIRLLMADSDLTPDD